MINDNVLKKWIVAYPTEDNSDSRLCKFNRDILRIKLGFTGIGNRHMSLIHSGDVKRGNKIIFDYYLDINGGNRSIEVSPKIFQIVSLISYGDPHNLGILLGVGEGTDLHGDPNLELEIGKTYILNNLYQYPTIIRLDSMGRYKSADRRVRNG